MNQILCEILFPVMETEIVDVIQIQKAKSVNKYKNLTGRSRIK